MIQQRINTANRHMHEVHPNSLWIGNASDIRNPELLFKNEISAVVDVAIDEPPAQLPRQLMYFRFPLTDGTGNDPTVLRLAVQTVAELLHSEVRTIVACSAGMSRSPTIAAFALAAHQRRSPDEVINDISKRRTLEIHPVLWSDVANIFPEIDGETKER